MTIINTNTRNWNHVIVAGTIKYARFVTPKQRFDRLAWEVTVAVTKAEGRKAFKAGVKVREVDGEFLISVHKEADGRSKPPIVVDRELNHIDGKMVGPGSKINLKIDTFEYTWGGRHGTGARLAAVQALKVVTPPSATESATAGFVAL